MQLKRTAVVALTSAAMITGTIAPTPAKADDGCDRECIETIFQLLRLAYYVTLDKYQRDKAACDQKFEFETPEHEGCYKSAFNYAVFMGATLSATAVGGVLGPIYWRRSRQSQSYDSRAVWGRRTGLSRDSGIQSNPAQRKYGANRANRKTI